jgi:glucokinase
MSDFVLGIDIGGTTIKAGLVRRDGTKEAAGSEASRLEGLQPFRLALTRLARRLAGALPRGGRLAAVGIGCKGRVDTAAGRVESLPGAFSFLEREPIDRWVLRAIGAQLPVRLDNDARAALAGERRWGAARGRRDVVLLTPGSGVGGAALSGGRLLEGHRGAAGHLGHLTVEVEGPRCSCGNRGCVEAIFSARSIEAEALAALRRGCESRLYTEFAARSEELTCLDVFVAAGRGDPVALSIVRRGVAALSAAMAGIAHALDPELFLLGGKIADASEDLLWRPLRRDLHARTERLLGRRIPVRRAALGEGAGLAGAAALAWDAAEDPAGR